MIITNVHKVYINPHVVQPLRLAHICVGHSHDSLSIALKMPQSSSLLVLQQYWIYHSLDILTPILGIPAGALAGTACCGTGASPGLFEPR
jgi:hypothetical protein